MNTVAHPRLLTISETARLLRVAEVTVRRKILAGEIPAIQLGGRGAPIRVDERELQRFIFGPGDAA